MFITIKQTLAITIWIQENKCSRNSKCDVYDQKLWFSWRGSNCILHECLIVESIGMANLSKDQFCVEAVSYFLRVKPKAQVAQ